MFSEHNSLSFIMGFPDFLEKDLRATECNFLSRPTLDFQDSCQSAPSNEGDEHSEKSQRASEFNHNQNQEIMEKQDRSGVCLSSLKIKLPEVREVKVDEQEEEEGCTTPTSLDHKIPQVCPPPPRKVKAVPSTNRKSSRRRVLLDLSTEIKSLFPPALLADFGNKIKKIKKESFII